MSSVLTYVINVSPPATPNIVQRELVTAVNGEVYSTSAWAGSAVDLGTVSAPSSAEVTVSLTDVDATGHRAQPSVVSFVATGEIPPAFSGITITLVGETVEQAA